jgi:Cu/Ag efflux protein CusF
MPVFFRIPLLLSIALAAPLATVAEGQTRQHASETKIFPATDLTAGEVRKVDKSANKITLRHEDIRNLGMPGMTMVFQVPDAALLDRVQVGDKVRFRAEKSGSNLVVTEIIVER